jgi:AcrR family transcriptional regulator
LIRAAPGPAAGLRAAGPSGSGGGARKRGLVDGEVPGPREQRLDGHPCLNPRERSAHAEVDAPAGKRCGCARSGYRSAMRCVDRYGPTKTGLSDVAAELGVTRQTVYRLFPSTEDLLRAVVVAAADTFVDRMVARVLDHTDPAENAGGVPILHRRAVAPRALPVCPDRARARWRQLVVHLRHPVGPHPHAPVAAACRLARPGGEQATAERPGRDLSPYAAFAGGRPGTAVT